MQKFSKKKFNFLQNPLVKQVFQLVEEALVLLCRVWFERFLVSQRLDHCLVVLFNFLRNPHCNLDIEVTGSAVAVHGREAAATESYDCAGLCARLHLDLVAAVNSRNFYFSSEDCVRK